MPDTDPRPVPEPALGDRVAELERKVAALCDLFAEQRREVDVLHAQVDDLTHLVLRHDRQDRNQRRERR